jgi:hypothetical protein
MVCADFYQGRGWQSAPLNQLYALFKGNDVILAAMEDDASLLDRLNGAPSLPGWAKEDESGVTAVDVHGDSTAS